LLKSAADVFDHRLRRTVPRPPLISMSSPVSKEISMLVRFPSSIRLRLTQASACAAVLGALLASRAAHADATATNHAYSCIPDGQAGASTVTIDPKGNKVTASSATTVHCPITIKSSSPAVTSGDGIKSVGLSTTGSVSCTINTRRAPVLDATNDLNDVSPSYSGSRNSTTKGTLTINTSTQRPVDYWHAHGYTASGVPAWYYSYLTCQLGAGATIVGDYTTTEYGTDTSYTIDPMFTCGLVSDMPWAFDEVSQADPIGNTQARTGGFVRAQAATGHQFILTCPVPANSSIEVQTSSPGVNVTGCNLNNGNLSSVTWTHGITSGQFPIYALPEAWQPVIEVQAQSTSNTMYCGGNRPAGQTLSGDTKWASYRVLPNLSRKGVWKGSASANTANVDNAYDNNGSTRWDSAGAGKKNMWFDVDLGTVWASKEYNQLTFDSGTSSPDDYPRQFSVWLSYTDNASDYFQLISGTSNNHQTTINFSEQSAKHVRIVVDKDITAADGSTKYWSIRELNLYFNDGTH
jgi:F5/8 type C domain